MNEKFLILVHLINVNALRLADGSNALRSKGQYPSYHFPKYNYLGSKIRKWVRGWNTRNCFYAIW